jgi:hypothetical protein
MKPNHEGMECWVDAAHASEWNNKTGHQSKMQTEIALSTTEAEYIALSQAMREVLPII